ncbi:hypothetical protein KY349_04880 [Candidatus Woesearchaeota archaeon]|nr:hypothetical protein [Candidatus Woesearchaeota archaeon]
MDLKILKERDTPLLSRKRFTFEVSFKGPTPTRTQLRDAIASNVKADKELTVVKHIYTRYGVEKAKVMAHVYTDKNDLVRYEEKGVLAKHMKKKEEKKEKEEAKPAPAEEKKEETKEEAKDETKAETEEKKE